MKRLLILVEWESKKLDIFAVDNGFRCLGKKVSLQDLKTAPYRKKSETIHVIISGCQTNSYILDMPVKLAPRKRANLVETFLKGKLLGAQTRCMSARVPLPAMDHTMYALLVCAKELQLWCEAFANIFPASTIEMHAHTHLLFTYIVQKTISSRSLHGDAKRTSDTVSALVLQEDTVYLLSQRSFARSRLQDLSAFLDLLDEKMPVPVFFYSGEGEDKDEEQPPYQVRHQQTRQGTRLAQLVGILKKKNVSVQAEQLPRGENYWRALLAGCRYSAPLYQRRTVPSGLRPFTRRNAALLSGLCFLLLAAASCLHILHLRTLTDRTQSALLQDMRLADPAIDKQTLRKHITDYSVPRAAAASFNHYMRLVDESIAFSELAVEQITYNAEENLYTLFFAVDDTEAFDTLASALAKQGIEIEVKQTETDTRRQQMHLRIHP